MHSTFRITSESSKMSDSKVGLDCLPKEMLLKILAYSELEDIFFSLQYINDSFNSLCKDFTLPKEIHTKRFKFLDCQQICNLIKNSTQLASFQYEAQFYDVGEERSIFEHLTKYATSLKRLYISSQWCTGSPLLSLIMCGKKITELELECRQGRSLDNALSYCTTMPYLPYLTKLCFRTCNGLKITAIIKLVNACPNLRDFFYHGSESVLKDGLMQTVINTKGPRLTKLYFNSFSNNDALLDLNNCIELETLQICSFKGELPVHTLHILEHVTNLIVDRWDVTDNYLADFLNLFPNLTKLTVFMKNVVGTNTLCKIKERSSIKELTLIDSKLKKQDIILLFHNCTNIQFARLGSNLLRQMSRTEVTESLKGLHTLELVPLPPKGHLTIVSVATDLANWLPQTKIGMHTSTVVSSTVKPKRIYPENCQYRR